MNKWFWILLAFVILIFVIGVFCWFASIFSDNVTLKDLGLSFIFLGSGIIMFWFKFVPIHGVRGGYSSALVGRVVGVIFIIIALSILAKLF